MRWLALFHMMDCLLWFHPMIVRRTKLGTRIRWKQADPPREMERVMSHLMVSSCLCLQIMQTLFRSVLFAIVEGKAFPKECVMPSDHGLKGSHILGVLDLPFLVGEQGRLGLESNKMCSAPW
jgi:hypothetical protein